MVDGGRRLLNQIGGAAYEPQSVYRLVSQVLSPTIPSGPNPNSNQERVATVITYTSKNELVTFDVKADDQIKGISPRPET